MKDMEQCLRQAARLAAGFLGVATKEEEASLEAGRKEDRHFDTLAGELLQPEAFERNGKELSRFPAEEAWEKISRRMTGGKRSRRIPQLWKYAALLAVAAGSGLLLLTRETKVEPEQTVRTISAGTRGARLYLGDGKMVDVGAEEVFTLAECDGTLIRKDSTGLDYEGTVEPADSSIYNRMETGRGMEYALTLSDGTRVFLNAESSLKFPATFQGRERKVELSGEAFFEVTKDSSRPFTVVSDQMEVRVTGTCFNLRAYRDEDRSATTLVQGSVEVNGRTISPGQQAVYSRETGRLEVGPVDTGLYTSWHEGFFVFRNERLGDILKTLARWYGFTYRFMEPQLEDLRIGARFERYEEFSPITDMLEKTGHLRIRNVGNCLYLYQR